jgi:hypothetical protein
MGFDRYESFSGSEPGPQPRDPRYEYGGTVRLIVPFSPWRLLLSLRGRNLSASGLQARLERASAAPMRRAASSNAATDAAARYGAAVEALIVEGDPYELQLEHDAGHLPAPVLPARLVRREATPAGLDLAFAFDAADTDLLSLVHELAQDERPDAAP